jgi:sec-independent protein translocase protein TatC
MALVPFPSPASPTVPDDDLEPDKDELDPDDHTGGKMSFLEHLDELRRRLVYAAIALFVGFVISFFFITEIFDFIMRPLQQMLPAGGTLVYTEPTEAFVLYIKIALIAGLIIGSPAIFAQVWLFIAPGLYSHEKKWAIPFVVMSSALFTIGAAFSHYVVFPLTWRFFVGFTTDIVTFMPRVEPAFSMYLRLALAFGVVFQMPVLVLFLARMGMLTARFMIKNFKYAVLIIIIVSAVITPDGGGVSLVAMAGPITLLYCFSIGLAWIFGKKKRIES